MILALTALPGYQSDEPMPSIALWRAVATTLGVALEVAVVALVLPVTARRLFEDTMSTTLEQMAGVARAAFHALQPRRHGHSSPHSLAPLEGRRLDDGKVPPQRQEQQRAANDRPEQHLAQNDVAQQQQPQAQEKEEQRQEQRRQDAGQPPAARSPHLAIEMQPAHASQQRLLGGAAPPLLPPLRIRVAGEPGRRPGAQPDSSSDWPPLRSPPVSPPSSCRRRRASPSPSGEVALPAAGSTPVGPGQSGSLERSQSFAGSDVSGRLSVYASWAGRRDPTFKVRQGWGA